MTRAVLALILLMAASVCVAEDDLSQYMVPSGFLPVVGEPLPSFELAQLNGGKVSLASFAGHPLVVTFFFSDCAPCVREVGALNAFSKSNPALGVVAITFDTADRASRFAREHGLEWPILVDAQSYFDRIGVLSFPSFALLDEHGVLLGATYGNRLGGEDGAVTAKGLHRWVKSLVPDV